MRPSTNASICLAILFGCTDSTLPSTGDDVDATSDSQGESSDATSTTAMLDDEGESDTATTSSDTDTDTETETSESETDTGDPVHHPPGTSPGCDILPGDHSSVCPEGEPCPIIDDVEIQCGAWGIGYESRGVSIDAEHVYTNVQIDQDGGWLFSAQGQSAESLALPDALDGARAMWLTGEPESGIHMVATSTALEHVYVIPDGDGFLLESISIHPNDFVTSALGIALDSIARPHVWLRQETGIEHGIRERDWTLFPTGSYTLEDEAAIGIDRLDRQVELVRIGQEPMVQLTARIDGVDYPIGDPADNEWLRSSLGQPMRPSAADPGDVDYSVVYQPELLHVAWPIAEDTWQEVPIVEAVPNLSPCPSECPCEGECVDDIGGVAYFRLVHVVGDELWLAWTNDTDHSVYLMSEIWMGEECTCWVEAWGDNPISTFHLARIDTTDGSYEHVLDMPLGEAWVLRLDVRAHERRLGVRMYTNDSGGRKVRLLGFDLDQF